MTWPKTFKPITVWATWRGPGWTPCLWGVSRDEARRNCDPDETVIQLRVSLAPKKRRRAQYYA